jgi:hypothetical protein
MVKGFVFDSSVSIWDTHKNERVRIGVRTCRDLLIVLRYGPCGVENCIMVLIETVHEGYEDRSYFV